ncbi:hypothetical protein [Cupriavidus sp. CuC1]|uniref:hypothetical protein n=1 Tax=Cupriavidus sp. CuC1 TaxID=3373131 RepID=UPI0037D4FD88
MTSLLAKPQALTARFRGILEDGEFKPRLARRVALHFADEVIATVPFAGLAVQDAPAASAWLPSPRCKTSSTRHGSLSWSWPRARPP